MLSILHAALDKMCRKYTQDCKQEKSMTIRTTSIFLALALSTFGLGCGGDTEATTPAESDAAPAVDRMAVARGNVKFTKTCATCHGPDAKGMPNLGKDLTVSAFFKEKTNEELVAFVNEGRIPMDGNAAMPPKGGFTELTDEEILNIIKYLRTIEQ
jgi:mono/diheme cytochrome c family protein